MYKFIIACLLVFNSVQLFAQSGAVRLIQPKELESLLQRHIALNSEIKRVAGWRIQIKSSTDRSEVIQTKIDFLTKFPDVKTYLTYQQPYFKFRVGDFTDRNAAYALMKDVNDDFKGIFVVPDIVNIYPEGVLTDKDDKFSFEIKEVTLSEIHQMDSLRMVERKKNIADSLAKLKALKQLNKPTKLTKADSIRFVQRKKVVADSLAKAKSTVGIKKTVKLSKADSLRIAQRKKVVADSLARIKKTTTTKTPVRLTHADSVRIAKRKKFVADSLARIKANPKIATKPTKLSKADSVRIAQRKKMIADSLARTKKNPVTTKNPKKLSQRDSILLAHKRLNQHIDSIAAELHQQKKN